MGAYVSMCQNCQERPVTTYVDGYRVCDECEARAYTRPGGCR